MEWPSGAGKKSADTQYIYCGILLGVIVLGAMLNLFRRLLSRDEGADLIEYSMLAAVIAIAAFSVMTAIGGNVGGSYGKLNTTLETGASGSGGSGGSGAPGGGTPPGNGNGNAGNGNGNGTGNGNGNNGNGNGNAGNGNGNGNNGNGNGNGGSHQGGGQITPEGSGGS
jgi:Flp pilus assembly pilin Flp